MSANSSFLCLRPFAGHYAICESFMSVVKLRELPDCARHFYDILLGISRLLCSEFVQLKTLLSSYRIYTVSTVVQGRSGEKKCSLLVSMEKFICALFCFTIRTGIINQHLSCQCEK